MSYATDSGRLRGPGDLIGDVLESVAARLGERNVPAPTARMTAEAGLVREDGTLDPAAETLFTVALAATTSIRLTVAGPAGRLEHTLAMSPELSTAFLQHGPDDIEVIGMSPAAWPQVVARLLLLGPRQYVGDPADDYAVRIPTDVLDLLFSADAADRARGVTEAGLADEQLPWRIWEVAFAVTDPGQDPEEASVIGFDTDQALHRVTVAEPGIAQLQPITASRMLCVLLDRMPPEPAPA